MKRDKTMNITTTSPTYTSGTLPEPYFSMLKNICIGRECSNCGLKSQCFNNFTLDKIQEVWDSIFRKPVSVTEEDIMSVLKGD